VFEVCVLGECVAGLSHPATPGKGGGVRRAAPSALALFNTALSLGPFRKLGGLIAIFTQPPAVSVKLQGYRKQQRDKGGDTPSPVGCLGFGFVFKGRERKDGVCMGG
jgi:hypothetical protein